MIVEAKRLENGFFIPMNEKLKCTQKEHILLNIELVDITSQKLEKKHKKGYLLYPVKHDEFSVWENEQIWCD
ncbi:MAG: hypothetical protein HQK77_20050 [Desulfobacterales bacterium]|nr:hypothetical protein [Desulfobacterales bacterium]